MNKSLIHSHCLSFVEAKIRDIQDGIRIAREASNSDTKSSMGDKYETTREMMQIEIDKLGKQLVDAQQMLLGLKVLNSEKICEKVEPGALVSTDKGVFYLSVGLGKVIVNGETVMVISAGSPIGRVMIGKKAGSGFALNQVTYKISEIR